MKGRSVLMNEMQANPVFSVVKLYRGKKMAVKSETQKYELEEVGKFHLFARGE